MKMRHAWVVAGLGIVALGSSCRDETSAQRARENGQAYDSTRQNRPISATPPVDNTADNSLNASPAPLPNDTQNPNATMNADEQGTGGSGKAGKGAMDAGSLIPEGL